MELVVVPSLKPLNIILWNAGIQNTLFTLLLPGYSASLNLGISAIFNAKFSLAQNKDWIIAGRFKAYDDYLGVSFSTLSSVCP